MADLITAIGSIVTGAIGWAGQCVTFITANPLVELFVLVGFVGLGVGLVKRFIR